MKKLFYNRKLMVSIFVVLILAATALALGPVAYSLFAGSGEKTEPVNVQAAEPASGELDGHWKVVQGPARNHTSAGFTFDEILPAERTETSGSTNDVSGGLDIADEKVQSGEIAVNMDDLSTDKQVRDQNMKSKLFETSTYPEATFVLTEPADVSGLPTDGSAGKVELTGDLTIKGKTHRVTQEFDALRTGANMVVGGNIPINRLDYGVETPEMIAAKIAEQGTVDVRLFLEKE